jgi:hypothetical protein
MPFGMRKLVLMLLLLLPWDTWNIKGTPTSNGLFSAFCRERRFLVI